jgi:hypothetical protein
MVIIKSSILFFPAQKMTNLPKKSLDEVLHESVTKKKVNELSNKTERKIEEVLSSHSPEDINKLKKQLEEHVKGDNPFPTGIISFKGIDISIDSIYREYHVFKKNYEDAQKYKDEHKLPDLANVFHGYADNKLIEFILFLVDKVQNTEGEMIIN